MFQLELEIGIPYTPASSAIYNVQKKFLVSWEWHHFTFLCGEKENEGQNINR